MRWTRVSHGVRGTSERLICVATSETRRVNFVDEWQRFGDFLR